MKGRTLFFFSFLLWFVANWGLYLLTPKSVSFIWINHLRSAPADIFFSIITYLGNGLVIVPVGLVCYVRERKKLAIGILVSFLVSGILTILLKHYFDLPRPRAWFPDPAMVKTAPWGLLRFKYSFPSGHTTSIFALATTVVLFLPHKRWIAGMCFLLACLTAYSRVYLGEHFVVDIWAGSAIGFFFAVSCFFSLQSIWKLTGTKELKNNKQADAFI